MRKRNTVIGFLVLVLLVGCALWNISRSTAQSNPQSAGHEKTPNPLITINEKARSAKEGDETATRDFVDEMFRTVDIAQEFAGMDEGIKERLVRAQINDRNSHGKSSCSEFRIVHAVNRLAERLGMPGYTRTNVFEVRRLRSNLLIHTPEVQTRRNRNDLRKDQKHDRAMSPVETFFIAAMLIQQKRYNPEYQLTNDEWIDLHGGKRDSAGSKRFNDEMQRRRIDSSRTEEVRQAIRTGFSAMSPVALTSLPDELLNTLGIER